MRSLNTALNTALSTPRRPSLPEASQVDLHVGRHAQRLVWHDHINQVNAPAAYAPWLTHRASLTARLVAHSQRFRVQRLHQGVAMCLPDEARVIGLPRAQKVVARDVILRCDEQAVVYAHTVMPLSANATQWPLFASLGEKSLGSTLFSDPLVQRGTLRFARLSLTPPLMQRIAQCGLLQGFMLAEQAQTCPQHLFARRSIFRRKGACLLVTEVFLPRILTLRSAHTE